VGFWPLREDTEIGAEAEALDADLKRSAAAMEQMLEERFETEGALDGVLDFGDFAVSEFFPARADRLVIAETVEKELDFA